MRPAHRLVGWITLLVFVATGVYLRFHVARLIQAEGESVRYAIRANHVYILFAALLNLVLSTGLIAPQLGWRRIARTLGRVLILVAPAILFAAFLVEGHHPSPHRPITAVGVDAAAAGVLLILLGGLRSRADRVGTPPAAAAASRAGGAP